ncbi:HD domain-containing phosphohydrolase [Geothrix sp. PMB-07]|uniref:HD domain-containing phosphohydrolase n=1 Tax=Geothrix sp. PMB-07 TaxID=3068640 RepID=UPI0027423E74|nr:HD domain-containing phosphohydrolase [Geothrix sp. PMB-07]WLT30858.1 response regulator [Geothrix sp. PMB-07]
MPLKSPIPILIVDDEADLRNLLVEALQDQGYAAVGADGGAQALARVQEQHFPVIFTDLNMPGGLSGLELLRAVHDRDPQAMGILMTGYATTESAIQALKRGAYDFIQKPFKLAEIEASLERALEHYRLLRENEEYQQNLERMVEARTQEILGLKNDIERLFEGFVNASVTAIEARDPSTSGHSSRVADLTVGLAEAVNDTPNGPYGGLYFNPLQIREIRYASLLHDFGKVGVREQVLVKAKKIEGERLESIFQRLHQRTLEGMRDRMLEAWSKGSAFDHVAMGLLLNQQEEETRRLMELVRKSNEPTVLPEAVAEELNLLGDLTYQHWTGDHRTLIDTQDLNLLKIPKGSLSEEERNEIQNHVTYTYRFLSQIPWTSELAGVPEIAWAHHERLNGKGYPRQLKEPDIPVQSKLMAVSDVYDALTAADRPYKAAVSVERSLQILEQEAKVNLLDAEVLKIFLEAKIYERTVATGRTP